MASGSRRFVDDVTVPDAVTMAASGGLVDLRGGQSGSLLELGVRFVFHETPLLRNVDLVVAIPPDHERYAHRGMSLPDQLAAAVERQLSLPWPMEALVKTKTIELRGLPWHERRAAVKGSMAARDVPLLKDRCVLLVDDVTTSGATLSEAARVVRAAGASDVRAVTLCHAEG